MTLKTPKTRPMALTAELAARCERPVPDPGRIAGGVYLSDDDFSAAARNYAAQNGDGPLWVFAYGSLIWNPGFTYSEHLRGIAHGWHRQFSMMLTNWRGTPEQP